VVRFLLTPRWLGLLVVVVLLGLTCVRLSEWQFHRYQERKDSNALVRGNLAAEPAAVGDLMSTTGEPSSTAEWRTVTAHGHYDAARQLAVLYRTRQGSPGVDVVTPFVTDAGPAVLVDRGWVPAPSNGNITQTLPSPARGPVTLSGWVRVDSDGNADQVTPSQGSVRAISAAAVGSTLPYPVLHGFLELTRESPASPHPPSRLDPPDLSSGPSFFYGFQWLFFALLFFGFWCYFAWAEYQERVNAGGGKDSDRTPRPRGKPWRPGADAEDDLDGDAKPLVTTRE